MDRKVLETLAERLLEAEREAKVLDRLTLEYPELGVKEAYEIQRILVERKVSRGGKIVGLKLGLTSKAKQMQMGIHEPIYGTLLDLAQDPDGKEILIGSLIHPKVEPEVAFVLKRELRGPGITIAEVLEATESLWPALEIIDSRYRDFKFTLPDVIADNTSASRFVLGNHGVQPQGFDLSLMGVVLEKNGEVTQTGAGASVLGHPAQAVVWLSKVLAMEGGFIAAGSVIMAGAMTEAVPLGVGDEIKATVEHVGSVSVRGT